MMANLSDAAYLELLHDDIEWLKNNTDKCLERTHIISILRGHERDILSAPCNKGTTIND